MDAGPVYISEFMAKNNKTYQNNSGTYADWLELYNPSSTAVTLGSATAGQSYYLTNDSTNPTLWAFPAGVTLGPGAYLVVNCDTTPSGAAGAYANTTNVGSWPIGTTQYYTGFHLPESGGYVALVQPDGQTIASQYNFPQQLSDVSYGIAPATPTSLVSAGAAATYLVPTASSPTTGWTSAGFDDSSWSSGPTGLGFAPATSPPPTTLPGPGYYAPYGPNGTWNYYEVVSTAANWTTAESNAAGQSFGGQTGHLVTVRSAAEVTFLSSLTGGVEYWTGLTNLAAYGGHDFGSTSGDSAPAQGSVPTSSPLQQGAGFVWADGEAFTYHNWESGQPNDSSSGSTPANYVAETASNGGWDDRVNSNNYPYVIEFNLGLTSRPDNGYLSVVEAHSSASLASISAGISLINNPGTATVTNYSATVADFFDPQNVATTGHFAAIPFGGDTTGVDHNFAVEVQGTVQIASAGTYTFDVNGGDGFQLSIGGQTFTGSSSGTTYGSTMTYSGTRASGDSLGVTTFAAAGTYPINLYYFDGASDAARVELSAAAGTQTSFNSNFHLVGDTTNGGLGVVGSSSLVSTNLSSAMKGVNSTALVRIPFSVSDPSLCTQLTLLMNYDDGFIAYLNGVQVASANAPSSPAWNSTATAAHGWSQALAAQSFNLANFQGDLVSGANILAIQGLNITAGDPDFLVLPQLQYSSFNINNLEYFTTPTPGAANVAGNLGTLADTSFTVPDGFYTAPFYTSITNPASAATVLYTTDGRTPVLPAFGSSESIRGIAYSGTTPTVTTSSAHGYFSGEQVKIAGAAQAQYDGIFTISVLSPTTFTYGLPSSPGSNATGTMTAVLIPAGTVNSRPIGSITFGGSGGLTATASSPSQTIGSISFSGTTATVTMSAADGFVNSQQVLIAGASLAQYDGVFIITVTGATTFTYSMATSPGSAASGSMTATSLHGYSVGQLVQISGASQWQYDGIFAIATVPSASTFTYTMSAAPSANATGAMTAAAVSTLAYSGPVYINSTTTLRAEAIEAGYFTSTLDTASYIFMNAVINQPQIFTDDPTNPFYSANQTYVTNPNFNADNFPQMWTGIDSADTEPHGGSPTTPGQADDLYSADYGMDPQVVNDPDYASTIVSDMQTIPTLSLVMNPDDFFGEGASGSNGIKGIYVNSAQDDVSGAASPIWKRETSVELINPDGSAGFQINAGIKMHGGGSLQPTKEAEHTFTLDFSSDYGGALDYPFFGPDGASSYSELTLRAGYNDSWTHGNESQRQYGSYLQDAFGDAELAAMGGPDRHDNWVNLYIDGIYWGVYNATEYPDSAFAADYLGDKNAADYDTIKVSETGPPVADDGDANAWNKLYVIASNDGAMNAAVAISSLTCTSTSFNSSTDTYTTTVTATTTSADGYSSGANVYISGAFPSQYDGYFIITAVNSTTFTYQFIGTAVASDTAAGTMTVSQIAAVNTNALANPASLSLVEQYLDVPEFISYMIDMSYGGNNDWQAGTNHNWIAISDSRFDGTPTTTQGGFQFINWDGERTLEGTTDNVINTGFTASGLQGTPAVEGYGPLFLFDQLKANPEFQLMWADAVHQYMFNNGPLSPAGAAAIYSTVSQPIDRAIVGESARWGNYRRDINYDGPGTAAWSPPAYLYTRNGLANSSYLLAGNTTTLFNNADDPNSPSSTPDTWIGNQNRMFSTYFPQRTANVISEYQAAGVYPTSLAAPEFSGLPTGGYLTGPLTITNPSSQGTIIYTTDGSDPRTPNVPSPILAAGTPSSVSEISLSGTTATVRVQDNGYANGQTVSISGATPSNYDGNFVISNVTQDTFQITVSGSPAAAIGTIVCQPDGISPSGGNVIVWLPGNGLAAGNKVLIAGAVQQTALNGVFTVTAATANTFSFALPGATLDTADTALTAQRIDAAVSGITFSGTTATVTTAAAHGYTSGTLVRIVGANAATFNGDYLITVLNSTQFQYTMSTTPSGAPTNGGNIGAVRVLSPTAKVYSGPLTLGQTTRVRARVLNGTTWSALNDAWFIAHPAAAAGNLAIVQMNYNPVGPTAAELAINPGFKGDDFQFMELQNIGSQTIDLTGVQLTLAGVPAFSFSGAAVTTLAPGAYVLIVENPQAFAVRYGAGLQALYGANWQSLLVAGEFAQELDHGGEEVLLTDRAGKTIEDFTYDNSGAWPSRAAGEGSTLELINPTDDPTDPNNWMSSLEYNGSPGAADSAAAGVVINEIVPNIGSPNNGSIEIYNRTASTINLGGWYLTDTLDDLQKFQIPAGTQIAAGQYLVYNDDSYDVTPYSGNTNGVVTETTDTDGVTPVLEIQGDTANELTEREIPLPAGSIVPGQDTVLTFDFQSTTEGQVQGIGLDNDNSFSTGATLYRIYGTGTTGTTVTNANGYYSTPGVWQTYTIDLGVIPANENQLFFYIDDSAVTGGFAGANAELRNVSVHSSSAAPAYINFDQYFGLNAAQGGDVWLVKADGAGNPVQFEDHATYGRAAIGEAWGDWPNGSSGNMFPMSSATLGAANSGPLVGSPVTGSLSLVISEVMYNPPDPAGGLAGQQLEYVKITNVGTTPVALADWRLRNAISFNFPNGQTLAAGASLLVVPYDPVNNPDALSRFEVRYPGFVSSQLAIDGPYSGALSNSGETLDLEQPGTPLSSDITFLPHWIEDEVAYDDSAPWPTAADGGGDSLQRLNLATPASIGWGDAAASWIAGPPTLGLLELPPVGNLDTYTAGGSPITITAAAGVLANDSGQHALTSLIVTPPAYGGLAFTSSGAFTYTPYFGQAPDSFQYVASDGTLLSKTITVLINPPLAASDSYNLAMNGTLTVPAATGVLANDNDPTGHHLVAGLVTIPLHGSLTLNGDGSFTYVPAAGYYGPDSFTYEAGDGVVGSAPATVSLAVNSGPAVALPAAAAPNPVIGTTTSLSVQGGDNTTGAASLTYVWSATTVPGGAQSPTFGVNGTNAAQNSTATFTAAGGYVLTATITDTKGLSITSSVSVTVNQTLTTISLAGQPLTATASDQFGNALADQPAFNAATDTITSPLTLSGTVTVLPAAGSQLTVAGGISGPGGLAVDDAGSVVLAGSNNYGGGTNIAMGTLVVGDPGSLLDGSNLTVGTFAGTAFGSAITAGALPASVPSMSAASTVVRSVPNSAAKAVSVSSASPAISSIPPMIAAAAHDAVLKSGIVGRTPARLDYANIAWYLDAMEAQNKRWAANHNLDATRIDLLLAAGGL